MNRANTVQHTIFVPPTVPMINLLGYQDCVLRALEEDLEPVRIHVHGQEIRLSASTESEIDFARSLLTELLSAVKAGGHLTPETAQRAAAIAKSGLARPADLLMADILPNRGNTIRPKTLGQKAYADAIDEYAIVFGIGPAGTGKTYLAMAKAVAALQNKEVSRIILTRPAVEAGESLGFLPGTLSDKIDPYLRPLYDALHDMLDPEAIPRLMAAGTIEVAPLAYMRGRTLNDAFIILDEAQNSTPEQMKMFLTRLGFHSRMVITGDLTQIDLPCKKKSGLQTVRTILSDVDGVHFSELNSADVVRHRLVADIIDAYARWNGEQ